MEQIRTKKLIEYLQHLAPRFFKERMLGASTEKIKKLEEAAMTQLSDSHKEFLTAFGGTPAQALNPFLNDRDYCVDNLLDAYAWQNEFGEILPPGIVYFSSSDILSETIMLRHAKNLHIEPEVGDIRPETGEFICKDLPFVSWLESFAFFFRISQPEYQLGITPIWDKTAERWLGESEVFWRLLESMGFRIIFSFENGTRCVDRGDMAAIIYSDGSGNLAGDNLKDLRKIYGVLNKNLRLKTDLKHENDHLRAPRD